MLPGADAFGHSDDVTQTGWCFDLCPWAHCHGNQLLSQSVTDLYVEVSRVSQWVKTLKMDARRKWDIMLPWGWRCSERPVHCWRKVHRISCLYEDYLKMQMRHCLIKDALLCIRFHNRNLKHWTTLVSVFFSILLLQRLLWIHLFMTPWIRKHCQQQWNIHLFCNVFGE